MKAELASVLQRPRAVRRVGRFTLGRRVGAGGMAAVFAAREDGPLNLGRLVALKVMSPGLLGDPAFEKLFLREAGITARLEHPHVVRVYEVGEADGTLFIAMEFVHGVSLRALFPDRSNPISLGDGTPALLPLSASARVLLDVASALAAAHELRGPDGEPLHLVHQDVSPHNVMVTYDGVTKLLDFGVARIGAIDASRTETVRGKPCYLSPEQILGRRVDQRTDLFALGAVMFEMLTGQRLFDRPSAPAVYEAISREAIPGVRAKVPDVPQLVADVCDRALQRDPDRRHPTLRAFAEALGGALAGAGIVPMTRGDLARLVATRVPPRHSPRELEQELTSGMDAVDRVESSQVADLPTQPVLRTPTGEDAEAAEPNLSTYAGGAPGVVHGLRPARARRSWTLALAGLAVCALAVILAVGRGGSGDRADASASAPRTTTPDTTVASTRASTVTSTVASTVASTEPPSVSSSTTIPNDASASSGPGPGPTTALATRSLVTTTTELTRTSGSSPVSASATATATTGWLRVHASPWGKVMVDGVVVGDSPIELPTTVGVHTVTVTTPDGKRQQQTVRVTADRPTTARFQF